jgi:HEAT repeat protein
VSATIPTVLALAGTALMAGAIFGPFARGPRGDAEEPSPPAAKLSENPQWTALLEPSAAACDVPARIDLAEALGTLQSPWAAAILRQALETERDSAVRSAIATALSSSQSLVT